MVRLLEVLGHPDAFVSNESKIGDFMSGKLEFCGMKKVPWREKLIRSYHTVPGTREAELLPVAAELQLNLKLTDYLIDVCALMRGQAKPN